MENRKVWKIIMGRGKKIVTYKNLLTVTEGKSMEPMVPLSKFKIRTCIQKEDMFRYTGNEIFVREEVAKRLVWVRSEICSKLHIDIQRLEKLKNLELVVTYGYRHPEVQKEYFEKILTKLYFEHNHEINQSILLYPEAHNYVAVPNVAGHPTGGAVDVTLYADGVELDMGTKIADFSKPELIPTFSPHITPEQLENRLVLRGHMMSQGFAPFNGEWWHFSYGDKEWAYWNHEKKSIYQQIEFTFKNVNV